MTGVLVFVMAFYVTVVSDYCELTDSSYRLRLPQPLFLTGTDWSVAVLDYKITSKNSEIFVLCDLVQAEIFGNQLAKLLFMATNKQILIPKFKKVTAEQINYITLTFLDRKLNKTVHCKDFVISLVFRKV